MAPRPRASLRRNRTSATRPFWVAEGGDGGSTNRALGCTPTCSARERRHRRRKFRNSGPNTYGQVKGARPYSVETYLAPRIGSPGPDWTKDIPLAPYHHFVLEYFFYMPSPAPKGQDQYLFWWDHEEALATANGVEYLSPPQKELHTWTSVPEWGGQGVRLNLEQNVAMTGDRLQGMGVRRAPRATALGARHRHRHARHRPPMYSSAERRSRCRAVIASGGAPP
jgi:hypothetical protein